MNNNRNSEVDIQTIHKEWPELKTATAPVTIRLGYSLLSLVEGKCRDYELIKNSIVRKYDSCKRKGRPLPFLTEQDKRILEGDNSQYFIGKLNEVRDLVFQKYFGPYSSEVKVSFQITDDLSLDPYECAVCVSGNEYLRFITSQWGRFLAIDLEEKGLILPSPAEKTKEPFFDLEAYWLPDNMAETAMDMGFYVVDSAGLIVVGTRLLLQKKIHLLINHHSVEKMLDKVKEQNAELVSEIKLEKKIPTSFLLEILRLLLKDGIPVYNFERILEAITALYKEWVGVFEVYKKVREEIAEQILLSFSDLSRTVSYISFSKDFMEELRSYKILEEGEYPLFSVPDSEEKKRLLDKIKAVSLEFKKQDTPVVLSCPSDMTYAIQRFLERENFERVFCISETEILKSLPDFKFLLVSEINKDGGLEINKIENRFYALERRDPVINLFLFREKT